MNLDINFTARWVASRCAVFAAVGFALLSGCASTVVDASWRDAQLAPGYLRGAKLLVFCETQELVLKNICQDGVGADLLARGATVVFAPDALQVPFAQAEIDPQLLQAARDVGAKAVFSVTIAVSSRAVSSGMSVSIGGFGFGTNGGAGIGVSAPIGGGKVSAGYAASGRVSDVGSGRLMWTARAAAPPSSDVTAQMRELSTAVVAEAQKAGLF